MGYREIFGCLSVIASLGLFFPYIISIYRKSFKPHSFSWFIWGLTQGIVYFAQLVSNAGPGAWATGVSSLGCFYVAILGIQYGERNITRSDWISLCIALFTVPLWLAIHNPLYSVIILATIDTVGYYPTVRKSWIDPHHESIFAFSIGATSCVLSFLSLVSFAPVNWIEIVSMLIANCLLVAIIIFRRGILSSSRH
jgi:hypothetical protein